MKESFDYIYSFGVLHHVRNIKKALKNVHDSLKDDGEFQIIVYNKRSVFYWLSLYWSEWIMKKQYKKMSFNERFARIEYTSSGELPYVRAYTKRELHALLDKCGFCPIETKIRKLVKEDLPQIKFLSRLYPFIPKFLLDFIGKQFGWYLSVRCIKKG